MSILLTRKSQKVWKNLKESDQIQIGRLKEKKYFSNELRSYNYIVPEFMPVILSQGCGGATHHPKSAKRSTFYHKVGKKWGFMRGLGPKGPLSRVPHPLKSSLVCLNLCLKLSSLEQAHDARNAAHSKQKATSAYKI